MTAAKTLAFLFVAGALGGLSSGILVWVFGQAGLTPALGFNMVPEFSARWIAGRMFASGIWGIIFLIPVYANSPWRKGAILGVLPWLSSILVVLPYRMGAGFLGLEMGAGTPVWTLFFGIVWGVTAAVFLARFHPELKLRA